VQPQDWPAELERLDRQSGWRTTSPDRVGLVELMRLYDVPTVGVAVHQDGAEPWPHTYGEGSVFQACSISKHVAAFGVSRLVDQGRLALDEDIDAY
jgi:CubicO group peptidase (beta-lactamase class C family)